MANRVGPGHTHDRPVALVGEVVVNAVEGSCDDAAAAAVANARQPWPKPDALLAPDVNTMRMVAVLSLPDTRTVTFNGSVAARQPENSGAAVGVAVPNTVRASAPSAVHDRSSVTMVSVANQVPLQGGHVGATAVSRSQEVRVETGGRRGENKATSSSGFPSDG